MAGGGCPWLEYSQDKILFCPFTIPLTTLLLVSISLYGRGVAAGTRDNMEGH